jgi:hypothetical protein
MSGTKMRWNTVKLAGDKEADAPPVPTVDEKEEVRLSAADLVDADNKDIMELIACFSIGFLMLLVIDKAYRMGKKLPH